jgi:hypothetical protein
VAPRAGKWWAVAENQTISVQILNGNRAQNSTRRRLKAIGIQAATAQSSPSSLDPNPLKYHERWRRRLRVFI